MQDDEKSDAFDWSWPGDHVPRTVWRDLEGSRCWAAASIRLMGVNKQGTWPKDLAAAGHVNKSGLVLIVEVESDEFGIPSNRDAL
jgi:hypothetical protein